MFNIFNKTKDQGGQKYTRPAYSLRNVHSEKVLDIKQDGENQGTAVIWKGWGGDNQVFSFIPQGDKYLIRSKKKSAGNKELFLTVDGPADGAKVYLA